MAGVAHIFRLAAYKIVVADLLHAKYCCCTRIEADVYGVPSANADKNTSCIFCGLLTKKALLPFNCPDTHDISSNLNIEIK